ncbi:hypothetical protein DYB32_008371 [Aphanomyces invadans]|uniref:Uncharacterized protein n=1 Tax=Aphanomyces invadans TaxID=157072 RepID=A0A3R6YZB6_9STRA|nr:hypothetical protein DYB32_008371 [Aphanomyces invadans]
MAPRDSKHRFMAPSSHDRHAHEAVSTRTLHVPLSPTGPPLMALLVHLPGRVFVRGPYSLNPRNAISGDKGEGVAIRLTGTFQLMDGIDVTTEAWRAGGLALRMCMNLSATDPGHAARLLFRRRSSREGRHLHRDSTREDGTDVGHKGDDTSGMGVGSLLVDIAVPSPLRYETVCFNLAERGRYRYVASSAETVVDQTALTTNDARHVGLVALNNSLFVAITRPNWTVDTMSLSSFGHGVVQVDAPSIESTTAIELKASGPNAVVAVAATQIGANVVEYALRPALLQELRDWGCRVTSNGAGSVYLTSRNLTVRALKSTMAGQGVISYMDNGRRWLQLLEWTLMGLGTCVHHAVSMLSSGEVYAGSLYCNETTVYSVGSGHVVVDGGRSLTSTTVGTGRLSYVRTLPDVVAHVGFAPRHGVHQYRAGDDVGPLRWKLLPIPRHEAKPVEMAVPSSALNMRALPTLLTLAMDVEALVGIALVVAVPMVLPSD